MNIHAKEFVPSQQGAIFAPSEAKLTVKVKKTKEERGPRKRRRKKSGLHQFNAQRSSNEEFKSEYSQYLGDVDLIAANDDLFDTTSNAWFEDTATSFLDIFKSDVVLSKSVDVQGDWMQEWKQIAEENDFIIEELERKSWGEWALQASEIERQRRISILKEIEVQQECERNARRKWAIEAIEKEQNQRISDNFLATLSSTRWFHEIISTYQGDYELVCPYYSVGCRELCRRSTLTNHIKECSFGLEICFRTNDEHHLRAQLEAQDYEVVCPNSVLGCSYCADRKDIQSHLQACPFGGLSREEETRERLLVQQHVISECEKERSRRLLLGDASSAAVAGRKHSRRTKGVRGGGGGGGCGEGTRAQRSVSDSDWGGSSSPSKRGIDSGAGAGAGAGVVSKQETGGRERERSWSHSSAGTGSAEPGDAEAKDASVMGGRIPSTSVLRGILLYTIISYYRSKTKAKEASDNALNPSPLTDATLIQC